MSRDEARHAGFINDALREVGMDVNLGFLTRSKKYTFFKPKFIFYATYLSEKIGYARYITIFRHLERNPDSRFHPIFKWFEKWCNDEFRHGEAFALLMKSDPKLTSGLNIYWIRFFLVAIYGTMVVRDHARPEFHKALNIDIEWYDEQVLQITSEISKQVFPIEIDLHNPRWKVGLKRLRHAFNKLDDAKRQGGFGGSLKKLIASTQAMLAFASLYRIPVKKNIVPDSTCLQPTY
jgi:magnesium-protoporphyrin IX monomethyl ester (oxidative) cyclase